MRKVFAIVFLALAVASAQDFCQLSLFTSIPALQSLYTNYKAQDWELLEQNVEKFIPTAQQIIQSCAGYNILPTEQSKRCLNSVYAVTRLFAPLANQLNNSAALVNLANKFKPDMADFYSACFVDYVYGEEHLLDIDNEETAIEDLATPVKSPKNKTATRKKPSPPATPQDGKRDILDCIADVSKMIPLLTTLVTDMKAKKEYNYIVADLAMIFMNVDTMCDHCGFKKPTSGGGPVDVQACLADAEVLTADAYLIIHSQGNIMKIFQGISDFFGHAPKALKDCGVKI